MDGPLQRTGWSHGFKVHVAQRIRDAQMRHILEKKKKMSARLWLSEHWPALISLSNYNQVRLHSIQFNCRNMTKGRHKLD